jgi:hypothetical protein
MRKMIELRELDKRLKEYNEYSYIGESFSEFVGKTKDNEEPVWR